jgi:hypothetical protein
MLCGEDETAQIPTGVPQRPRLPPIPRLGPNDERPHASHPRDSFQLDSRAPVQPSMFLQVRNTAATPTHHRRLFLVLNRSKCGRRKKNILVVARASGSTTGSRIANPPLKAPPDGPDPLECPRAPNISLFQRGRTGVGTRTAFRAQLVLAMTGSRTDKKRQVPPACLTAKNDARAPE